MLNQVFSFHFIGITCVLVLASFGLAYLCFFLQKHLHHITAGEWLLEHVYCPFARVLMLILMVYLLMPLIQQQHDYTQLFSLFLRPDFLINMTNLLFLSSLIFSFIPVIGHPALAMPILGCMSTAVFFKHANGLAEAESFNGVPALDEVLKLLLIAIILYLLARWLNNKLSEWADHRFIITGSKEVITDINSLVFQVPIILAYGKSLALQLN